MIAIVDYGAGNTASVKRAIEHLGHSCVVSADVEVIVRSDRIIVPGVGNFRATSALSNTGLTAALAHQISIGKPLLGICLGLQWLFSSSEEAPEIPGLGAFAEICKHLPQHVKAPHVGWDQLEIYRDSRILRNIHAGQHFYFTHRYYAPVVRSTAAACRYGEIFSAVIEFGNLFGVQFHPEKSGETGLRLLGNFCTC
jgi:imidazole glycerol-phosphate synthase subunit HisH